MTRILLAVMRSAPETPPIGKSREARERNAKLLGDYDLEKYIVNLTGFAGQDRQRIFYHGWKDAIRVRVGSRRNFKPGMACLPNGTLVIAVFRFRLETFGSGPVDQKYEIRLYESDDRGLTWEPVTPTNLSLCIKEPGLTALPDGSLVLTGQDPVHEAADVREKRTPVSRSADGGRTWETTMIPANHVSHVRNLVVEPDGSLLMVRNFDKKGDNPNLELGRSRDGGRTWEFSEGIVDWNFSNFAEVAPIRLRDGRLLAALRSRIPGTTGEGFNVSVLTESVDDGKTWARPWQISNTGEAHAYLTELNDGRLLATYTNYHLPWGIYAVVSDDGGKTWDLDDPIQLALSADLNVGWPVTLQFPDDSLVTAYGSTTHMQPSYVSGPYQQWSPEKLSCEVVCWQMPRPKR